MKGKLFIISGPSGVGKGTIVAGVYENLKTQLRWLQTITTREARGDDKDTARHLYMPKDQFKKMMKNCEIAEYNFYNGNYYGTPKSEMELVKKGQFLIGEIDINGGFTLKKQYPDNVDLIFLYSPLDIIKKRLIKRGQNTKDEIKERLKIAENEIQLKDKYDYQVVNPEGHPQKAIEEVEKIIKKELE